jgi:hypothetical protein
MVVCKAFIIFGCTKMASYERVFNSVDRYLRDNDHLRAGGGSTTLQGRHHR